MSIYSRTVKVLVEWDAVRYWLQEIVEAWRSYVLAKQQVAVPATTRSESMYVAAAALTALRQIAQYLPRRPELIFSHPLFVYFANVILTKIANGEEPSLYIHIAGSPGSGKTTMAMYLLAMVYGYAWGLCRGRLGRFAAYGDNIIFAELPSVDCGLEPDAPEPPRQWQFLADAYITDVRQLLVRQKEAVAKLRLGEPMQYWALLLDEIGASSFSGLEFHLRRNRYVVASMAVQLIRTGVPLAIATSPSLSGGSKHWRSVVNYIVYIEQCTIGACPRVGAEESTRWAFLRVESKTAPIGLPYRSVDMLMIGRHYMPRYPLLTTPKWFYARHLDFRGARLEELEKALEETEKKKRREEEEEE